MKKLLAIFSIVLLATSYSYAQSTKYPAYEYKFSSRFSSMPSDSVVLLWDSVTIVYNTDVIKADTVMIRYKPASMIISARKHVVLKQEGKEEIWGDRYTIEYPR